MDGMSFSHDVTEAESDVTPVDMMSLGYNVMSLSHDVAQVGARSNRSAW